MSKSYYSLIVRFDEFDTWAVQFGDYDRETVQAESEDYAGGCYAVRIIKTKNNQAAIDAEIAELNNLLEV